jgi:hypothetical protein
MSGMAQPAEFSKRRKQYFKSWASYEIPMRPANPVSYSETEGLTTYYLGEYDEQANLVRFVKFLREVRASERARVPVEGRNKTVYFDALPEGNRYRPGRQLAYAETEGRPAYFTGSPGGENRADVNLVMQTVFFDDEYSYWPNRQLKQRVMRKKDGTVLKWAFDRAGNEISRGSN